MVPQLVPHRKASAFLGLGKSTLNDRRVRNRLGLRAVFIGSKMMFREDDLVSLIERGLEKLPVMPAEESLDAAE